MDNLTENIQGTAKTAEADEDEKEVATDLGKFKDVQALMNAYTSLEAEFTRRSQRLKELEEKSKANEPTAPAAIAQSPSSAENLSEQELYTAAVGSSAVKERIIGDYLKTVTSNRGVPIVTGGISVPTPRNRPVSIKEAGRLAQEFLKNQIKGE